MPFFPCLASGRCRAGHSRVLRLLPMGRNLRVEPFCFARKEVSPMVDCSLPLSLGGLRMAWEDVGRNHYPLRQHAPYAVCAVQVLHGQLISRY